MADYGPTRADGGIPFQDVAPTGSRIGGLVVWHGGKNRNVIVGIQVLYQDVTTGALVLGEQHGGAAGADVKQAIFVLKAGEFITQISGRFGQFVDSLTVETNLGARYGRYGGLGGFEDYEFPPTSTDEIVGFLGKSGTLIDSIGCRTE